MAFESVGEVGEDRDEGSDDLGGAVDVADKGTVEVCGGCRVLGQLPGRGGFDIAVEGGDGVDEEFRAASQVEIGESVVNLGLSRFGGS